jgi:hypothetical protein
MEPLGLSSPAAAEPVATTLASQSATSAPSGAPTVPLSNTLSMSVSLANPVAVNRGSDINQGRHLFGVASQDKSTNSSPPVIESFVASEGQNGCWDFSGTVVADSTLGLVINFGGLPSLQGQVVQTQADGTFDFSIRLRAGERGLATAQATDWLGQRSNVAVDWVDPNGGK